MTLIYRNFITREMIQAEPKNLFVFGDNMKRRGMGGQAREMRGEPNAIGIPTKHEPSMKPSAFFCDDDYIAWATCSGPDICDLLSHEGIIVWPELGIGTGLAALPSRAPKIWRTIECLRLRLYYNPNPTPTTPKEDPSNNDGRP